MPSTATRTESDSFGPIQVPADCYWGAQTERSIGNFPFGRKRGGQEATMSGHPRNRSIADTRVVRMRED